MTTRSMMLNQTIDINHHVHTIKITQRNMIVHNQSKFLSLYVYSCYINNFNFNNL